MSYHHHPHNFTLSPTEQSAQQSNKGSSGQPAAAKFPPLLQTLDTYVDTVSDAKVNQEIQMLKQQRQKQRDGKPAALKKKAQRRRGNPVSRSLTPTDGASVHEELSFDPTGSVDIGRLRVGERSLASTVTGDCDVSSSLYRSEASTHPQPPAQSSKSGANRNSPMKRTVIDPLSRSTLEGGPQKVSRQQ